MPARRESWRASLAGDVCPRCEYLHLAAPGDHPRRRDRDCERCGQPFRAKTGSAVVHLTRPLAACEHCGTRTTAGDDGRPEPHGCPAARPGAAPPAAEL